MKAHLKSLVFCAAFIAGTGTAALAGGEYYNGGGYSGVPVPAPIPVPLYDPVWYFRADTALLLTDGPDASEHGLELGGGLIRATTTGSVPSGWIDSDYQNSFTWAVGIGYRWDRNWRFDVTGETLSDHEIRIRGTRTAPLAAGPGQLRSTIQDSATLRGGAVMFNAYYDFEDYRGFRPYLGAGLGLGIREIHRDYALTDQVVGGGQLNYSGENRTHEVNLAATVMIGATYRLTDITELDLNYRYLWVGGADSTIDIQGSSSTISADDTHDHQLRAGLRFNVN